eukprot:538597-Alexandrium_andersonii.AAC.1
MWQSQKRHLSFDGLVTGAPPVQAGCLPQGDPWSPALLCFILAPVLQRLQSTFGLSASLCTYVDDRTSGTRSIAALVEVEAE